MKNPLASVTLIRLHVLLYSMPFIWSLHLLITPGTTPNAGFIAVTLLWSPIVLIHAITYGQARGGMHAERDERQAYRDGFNDAVKQFQSSQNISLQHLTHREVMLEDDGELVEVPRKQKNSAY